MTANVRIVMTGHGRGEVFLDGVKVEGITGFTVGASARGDQPNELVLTMIPESIQIEGVFDVKTVKSEAAEHRTMGGAEFRFAI